MRWGIHFKQLIIASLLTSCDSPAQPVIAVPSPTPAFEPEPLLPISSPTPTPEAVIKVIEEAKPPISLPPAPTLTAAGRTLILEFETGGFAGYDKHPEWPGGASGVTVGIGFDCGYYSRGVILSDWHKLDATSRTRLADTSGITGQRAKEKVRHLRDIIVEWSLALGVFDNVDVAREYSSAKRAMPSFEDVRPNAQAAIISLGFNRGWAMSGPNRVEMRAIRDLVPKRDYEAMASELRKMIRIWTGTSIESGMRRRRLAEARLMETP